MIGQIIIKNLSKEYENGMYQGIILGATKRRRFNKKGFKIDLSVLKDETDQSSSDWYTIYTVTGNRKEFKAIREKFNSMKNILTEDVRLIGF